MTRRAERAAIALERAWGRWRVMHGLDTNPPPPVTSYVGYSFDEPWGQPRVVFGVGAEEAERLAALLDGHDCVGPVHAELTGRPDWRRTAPADPAVARTRPLSDALSIPAQRRQPASDLLPPGSKADTATIDDAATGSPAADPVVAEPVAGEPVVAEPVVTEPAVADPVVAEPAAGDTVVAEPALAEPLVADPETAGPVVAEPAANGGDTPGSGTEPDPPVASRSQLSPMLPAVPMLPVPTHDLAGARQANGSSPKDGRAAAGQPGTRQPRIRQPEAGQRREASLAGDAILAEDASLAGEPSLAAEPGEQDEPAGTVQVTAAPASGGRGATPSQGPGHRGRRYQGLPPRYQPGPVPEPPAEVQRADSENAAATTEPPGAGMTGKLSRLSRPRRAGKHDAGGWSEGGHEATDTAV